MKQVCWTRTKTKRISTLLGTRTALRSQTCTATDIVLSGSVVVKVKKEDRAQALSGREAEARTSLDLATALTGAKARRPISQRWTVLWPWRGSLQAQ